MRTSLNRRIFGLIIGALVLAICFAGCSNPSKEVEPVKIGALEVQPDVTELTISPGEVTAEALIAALPALPELRTVELSNTTMSVQDIASLRESGLVVNYTVNINGQSYGPDAVELDLSGMDMEQIEKAADSFDLFPDLASIKLTGNDGNILLNANELNGLRERYPNLGLGYSVLLNGRTYDPNATQVDLSGLTSGELDEVLLKLALLPQVQEIELMDAQGKSELSMTEVKVLMDALPNVDIHYTFEFFGQTLSTSDTRVEYDSVYMGNEAEDQIRLALDILPNCTYFLLDSCGIDDEVMASIRDDYPDVKVVWRVFFEACNLLTDEEVIRVTFELTDENCAPLQYCTDAVYVDIGHNDILHDMSFFRNMPRLECVIVSGAAVEDMTVFENCDNLTWLELCFCGWITDISVLENHPALKYLNISFTSVSDISVLENVALERLNAISTKIPYAERRDFTRSHPDCVSVFDGTQPYGYGWRYDDGGYLYFDYYARMREIFRYDDTSYFGNHKGAAPGYLDLVDEQ